MALNRSGHGNVIFACAAMLFCISDAKIGFHISSWFSKKAKFIFQCSKNFVGLLDQIEIFWFSGTNSLRIYHQKEMRLREYWERQKIQVQFCRRSRRKKIAPMILKMRKDSLRLDKRGWKRERYKLSINSIIEFSFGKISFKRWLNFLAIEWKTSNSKLQLPQKDWFFVIFCLKW